MENDIMEKLECKILEDFQTFAALLQKRSEVKNRKEKQLRMTPLNLAFSFCVFASDLFWSNVAQHAKKFGKNVLKIRKLEFFLIFL